MAFYKTFIRNFSQTIQEFSEIFLQICVSLLRKFLLLSTNVKHIKI
jgi:hypothetical protein